MNKKIIIVTGFLASGKTIFSLSLAQKLQIPCFNRDNFKITLVESCQDECLLYRKELSKVAFNVMVHVIIQMMEAGQALIIEGSFNNIETKYKDNEEEIIRSLVQKYDYSALTFVFTGDMNTLHNRFIKRDQLPERERAIRVNGLFDDIRLFEKANHYLQRFSVGKKIVHIDTTDFTTVNFRRYIQTAYSFIYEE